MATNTTLADDLEDDELWFVSAVLVIIAFLWCLGAWGAYRWAWGDGLYAPQYQGFDYKPEITQYGATYRLDAATIPSVERQQQIAGIHPRMAFWRGLVILWWPVTTWVLVAISISRYATVRAWAVAWWNRERPAPPPPNLRRARRLMVMNFASALLIIGILTVAAVRAGLPEFALGLAASTGFVSLGLRSVRRQTTRL